MQSDVIVFNMRVRKIKCRSTKVEMIAAKQAFSDSDETEEKFEEDDDDVDFNQVPHL